MLYDREDAKRILDSVVANVRRLSMDVSGGSLGAARVEPRHDQRGRYVALENLCAVIDSIKEKL